MYKLFDQPEAKERYTLVNTKTLRAISFSDNFDTPYGTYSIWGFDPDTDPYYEDGRIGNHIPNPPGYLLPTIQKVISLYGN